MTPHDDQSAPDGVLDVLTQMTTALRILMRTASGARLEDPWAPWHTCAPEAHRLAAMATRFAWQLDADPPRPHPGPERT